VRSGLLVLIELFSLGVTVETLQANIDRKSGFLLERGQYGPKFQVQVVVPPPFTILRIGKLGYTIRMWAQVSFVLSQCTSLTDG